MPVPSNQEQMPTAFKMCTRSADIARFQGLYVINMMTKGCRGQLRPVNMNA